MTELTMAEIEAKTKRYPAGDILVYVDPDEMVAKFWFPRDEFHQKIIDIADPLEQQGYWLCFRGLTIFHCPECEKRREND